MKFYKTVLRPITVPGLDYCWKDVVCEHFDNEGGHGHCLLDIGSLKRDKEGYYPKPKECLALKEREG